MTTVSTTREMTKKDLTKKSKAVHPIDKRSAGGPVVKGVSFAAENMTKTITTSTLSIAEQSQFFTRAIMDRVTDMGLITDATKQIGARLPTGLLERAKERTGLISNTDLLIFALANLAVEDNFADAFASARGTVDADLEF